MAKQKKSSHKKPRKLSKLELVLLATAILNLVSAIINFINKLI